MKVSTADFLHTYKELFLRRTPYIAPLAYWKMRHLVEESEVFYLPEHDCTYAIRDRQLIVYHSPDGKLHIPADELNTLGCIALPAALYAEVEPQLSGFSPNTSWSLRYDFSYAPPAQKTAAYDAVDFDFDDAGHFRAAAEIIAGDDGWMTDARVRSMMRYSAFDPSFWFFVRDKESHELVAISISAYEKDVRQTDLDWIFVRPSAQGKGAGRFLIEETIRRCAGKSDDICVGGTVAFYRKCGFYEYELWTWAQKDGYAFVAPSIQPQDE